MMTSARRAFAIVIYSGAVVVLLGCGKATDKSSQRGGPSGSGIDHSSSSNNPSNASSANVTASILTWDLDALGKEAFLNKYKGMELTVEGVVDSTSELNGCGFIRLDGHAPKRLLKRSTEVHCVFRDEKMGEARKAATESIVRVHGTVSEMSSKDDVVLESVSVALAQSQELPGRGIEVKATQLSQDLRDLEEEDFFMKYDEETLLVDGQVARNPGDEIGGKIRVDLLGDADSSVSCNCGGKNIADAQKLQKGSTVRIRCKLSDVDKKYNDVTLMRCQIISSSGPKGSGSGS